MKILKYFRKIFFVTIFLISYLLIFYYIYFSLNWSLAILFLIVSWFLAPYFYIEIKYIPYRILLLFFSFATFLQVMIVDKTLFLVLSIIFYNLSFIYFFHVLDDEVNNRVSINTFSLFVSWISMFSFLVSMFFSSFILYKYSEFKLTCDMLYNKLENLIWIVASPLKLSVQEVNNLKNILQNFYNMKIKDIVDKNEVFLFSWYTNLNQISNFSWNISYVNLYIANNTGLENKGILAKIQKRKYSFIDKVLSDKKSVDKWICEYMISKIKDIYQKPSFKISVFVLISFLLWPFIRIWFLILSVVNWVLFRLLVLLRIYKISRIEKLVDEIT